MRREKWKVDVVRQYLERAFSQTRIDDYARGGEAAHLFLVVEILQLGRQRVTHQLLVTAGFFERFKDHASLREALSGADVANQLETAKDRTVELR